MEAVIILHGLARTRFSMRKIAKRLKSEGFSVTNIDYPSTRYPVEVLAERYLHPAIVKLPENIDTVHFVTHSLGGIIIRYYLQEHKPPVGRIVMLVPPNRGSELAETLKGFYIYRLIYGPAGLQVGTNSDSIVHKLKTIEHEIGIIAGNKPINPITAALVGKENDGKVSVENTKLPEMKDFLIVPGNHTFIMRHPETIEQTVYFLREGKFKKEKMRS